jgi:selenocysteine lyase/cysteine desulfurase
MAPQAHWAALAGRRLAAIEGLAVQAPPRTGVLAFALRQQPAAAVVAVLAAEFGIRLQHSHGAPPGRVWLPLGPPPSAAEIDALVGALQKVAQGEFTGVYLHDAHSGDYVPLGTTVAPPARPQAP